MRIEESDFRMISESSDKFWDLELLQTVKSKSGESRSEFKPVGYGMSIESCMKRIINYRIAKKQEVFTLKEYVSEYKKAVQELEELFKLN